MSRTYLMISFLFFAGCTERHDTIRIKGSDTEVNLVVRLTESFRSPGPTDFISVSGGGSGLGIASLINGTADIANSSRRINSKELELFRSKKIEIDSFVFAVDAIAFVVADDLNIDSVHIEQLVSILSGNVTNWSFLGNTDRPITVYGRQSNSGTHDFVRSRLGIEFTPHARQMNGNAQILAAIRADHSGIGYVGAGYVMKGEVDALRVLTVYSDTSIARSPLNAATIAKGQYYFQRPLYQYYRKQSFERVRPFLDFEMSAEGVAIIRNAGYYEVNRHVR